MYAQPDSGAVARVLARHARASTAAMPATGDRNKATRAVAGMTTGSAVGYGCDTDRARLLRLGL